MTHTLLVLILIVSGQSQPMMHREEVESMEKCEHLAHEFNIAPMPARAEMAQAACMRVLEEKEKT